MSSTVLLNSDIMPTPFAIALAVIGWSPVTMITCQQQQQRQRSTKVQKLSQGSAYPAWHRRLQATSTTKNWMQQHQKWMHRKPELPAMPRTFLSQMRSGYCARLNSYRHQLNQAVPNTCLGCNTTPHSVT